MRADRFTRRRVLKTGIGIGCGLLMPGIANAGNLRARNITEVFEARHHNAHQLEFDGDQLIGMQVMQLLDHDDDELRQLEAYVGRIPRFDQ